MKFNLESFADQFADQIISSRETSTYLQAIRKNPKAFLHSVIQDINKENVKSIASLIKQEAKRFCVLSQRCTRSTLSIDDANDILSPLRNTKDFVRHIVEVSQIAILAKIDGLKFQTEPVHAKCLMSAPFLIDLINAGSKRHRLQTCMKTGSLYQIRLLQKTRSLRLPCRIHLFGKLHFQLKMKSDGKIHRLRNKLQSHPMSESLRRICPVVLILKMISSRSIPTSSVDRLRT